MISPGLWLSSREQAYQALAQMQLEWDPGRLWQQADLEAMVTVGEGQGVVIQKDGNVSQVLESGTSVEAEYRTPMAYHAYLEPLAAVADVRSDRVDVWASTQAANRLRGAVADAVQLNEDEIIIHPVYLGGGFGRKVDERAAVEAARLSQAVGRPVQIAIESPRRFPKQFCASAHPPSSASKPGCKRKICRRSSTRLPAGRFHSHSCLGL